jgi:hypothetical protein
LAAGFNPQTYLHWRQQGGPFHGDARPATCICRVQASALVAAAAEGALDHIPGEDGLPVVGTTLRVLADPPAYGRHMLQTYGRVFRTNSFGVRNVNLVGADANELVLFDRDKIFSSDQGWSPVLHLLFPRGLMLLDFEKHRADRRALSYCVQAGTDAALCGHAQPWDRDTGSAVGCGVPCNSIRRSSS